MELKERNKTNLFTKCTPYEKSPKIISEKQSKLARNRSLTFVLLKCGARIDFIRKPNTHAFDGSGRVPRQTLFFQENKRLKATSIYSGYERQLLTKNCMHRFSCL